MARTKRKPAKGNRPGPEPDSIVFEGDPAAAIRKILRKKPPPEGWPEENGGEK